MKFKPIIVVAGEPNSIFSEIFIKSVKNKIKSPIILICSKKLLRKQAKFLKLNIKFNNLEINQLKNHNHKLKKINLVNVNYTQKKTFDKISSKSNTYLKKCFELALKLIKMGVSNKLINGPISKENFLKNKFNGITEYLAYKTKTKNFSMIIYNKKLSVSPITTHLPVKFIAKNLNKSLIINKIKLTNKFWLSQFNKKPKFAVTGLNPHCESIDKFKEDKEIIVPAVKELKKCKIDINGPFAADTIFLKNNRDKYDLIFGMYHDQVLTPIKTLFEYNAINITVGLPFIRVSPDHGPNQNMIGKNISNSKSMSESIRFLDF